MRKAASKVPSNSGSFHIPKKRSPRVQSARYLFKVQCDHVVLEEEWPKLFYENQGLSAL